MTPRCPRCGRADAVEACRRRGLGDRLAALFWWRPYACGACRRRFRAFVAPFGLGELPE